MKPAALLALVVFVLAAGGAAFAHKPAAHEPDTPSYSDSRPLRIAKTKKKQPQPKQPDIPDTGKNPSPPPGGPVPVPYPNTIK